MSSDHSLIAQQKKQLRHEALLFRRNLSMSLISEALCKQLLNWKVFDAAQHILFYMPFQNEINLLPLVNNASHKYWYIPAIHQTEQGKGMSFHRYEPGQILKPTRYGIEEPESSTPQLDYGITSHILVLVPGLVFDRHGFRLGYGKGYYDRFLPSLIASQHHRWAGIVPEALLYEQIPHDSWDIGMQFIVTESNIYQTQTGFC